MPLALLLLLVNGAWAQERQSAAARETLPSPSRAGSAAPRMRSGRPLDAYTSVTPWYGPRRFSGYYTYRPRMEYERLIEHGAYSTSNSRYGFPFGVALAAGFADVAAYPVGNGNPYAYQSPWYWNPMNANAQVTSPNPYPFQYPQAYLYPYPMSYGGYGGYGPYSGYGPPNSGAFPGQGGSWNWNRQFLYAPGGGFPPMGGYTPGTAFPNAGGYAPNFNVPFGGPQAFGGGNPYYW